MILNSLKERITYLSVEANVNEFDSTDDKLLPLIVAAIEKAAKGDKDVASVDPVGENRMPRMLQLSGFLTYPDEVNLNDRAFTKADLDECIANGMFRAPFFGMIDYNHDFTLYGVWYNAEMRYDTANAKWGIWGDGVIFAWRYGELANNMLAMQQRNGHIKLSVAVLSEFYEPAKTAEGKSYLLMRKPVFFTTSVLDVDPAYPDARARGSEDPNSTPEKRAAELLAGDRSSHTEEADMTVDNTDTADVNDTKAEVEEEQVVDTATEKADTATEDSVDADETIESDDSADEAEDVAADEEVEDEVVEEPKDLASQLAAATLTLKALKEENDRLAAEVAALVEKENAREAARLEAERVARDEARMAELPEHIAAEVEKEENAALLKGWLDSDDASWEETKKVFAMASLGRKSLAERSAEEGQLSTTTEKNGGKWAISRHKSEIRTKRKRK